MNSYLNAIKNYVNFSGRATRSEFWLYLLFSSIILIICAVIDGVISPRQGVGGALTAIAGLFHLLPNLSISVRRLHDANMSGWWLIPGVIPLVYIILMLLPSKAEGNKYGAGQSNGPVSIPSAIPAEGLEKLVALKNSGAITEEEFLGMKKKLLGT